MGIKKFSNRNENIYGRSKSYEIRGGIRHQGALHTTSSIPGILIDVELHLTPSIRIGVISFSDVDFELRGFVNYAC